MFMIFPWCIFYPWSLNEFNFDLQVSPNVCWQVGLCLFKKGQSINRNDGEEVDREVKIEKLENEKERKGKRIMWILMMLRACWGEQVPLNQNEAKVEHYWCLLCNYWLLISLSFRYHTQVVQISFFVLWCIWNSNCVNWLQWRSLSSPKKKIS